jgi:hypothetical protein
MIFTHTIHVICLDMNKNTAYRNSIFMLPYRDEFRTVLAYSSENLLL